MKKFSKLLLFALFIALLIFFGTSCKNGNAEGSDANKSPTRQEIKNAAIAILKEKIDYKNQDKIHVTHLDNRFGSIEIRTQKTAEMLFRCIRNSKKIVDFTGIKIENNYCNVAVASRRICNFKGIYIDIPQFEKTYYIEFRESDSNAFYEHVMKLVDALPTYQEIKDAAIAILQDQIVYGDQDEITVYPNGEIENIEIRTKETAELLFNCIRNSNIIYDYTDAIFNESPPDLVRIGGRNNFCYFDSIGIRIPQFDRYYRINFEKDDSELLYEHVMKLKDEHIKKLDDKYAAWQNKQ